MNVPYSVESLRRYFEENWGAPLIIAFVVLMLAASLEFDFSINIDSMLLVILATYFLICGIGLQVAAFAFLKRSRKLALSNYIASSGAQTRTDHSREQKSEVAEVGC
jgi:hypothetical protein